MPERTSIEIRLSQRQALPEGDHFTSATGLALERLHGEGLLEFDPASDGEFMLAGPAAGVRRISHVQSRGQGHDPASPLLGKG